MMEHFIQSKTGQDNTAVCWFPAVRAVAHNHTMTKNFITT